MQMNSFQHAFRWPWRHLSSRMVAMGLLGALLLPLPAAAAERIFFKRGPLVRSLPVSSLEAFARDGTIDRELAFYIRLSGASDAELESFRQALLQAPPIDRQLVAQFLYSSIGEDLLSQFGEFIKLRGGANGKPALRAALLKASSEPEGLTLLNVLRHLPTNIQINLDAVVNLQQTIARVIAATTESVAQMSQAAAAEAAQEPPVDYSALPDLTQPGPFQVAERQIRITQARAAVGDTPATSRSFYVNLYTPAGQLPGRVPVVIYSHGLSASPENHSDRLRHLASYGFVVAAPQHIGSDAQHIEDFRRGLSQEIFLTDEFVSRPGDISAVIDELERRNSSEFGGRLDLQQVGVAGHSFGGYAALAVAGAKIDFEHLQQECSQQFAFLNLSLLLQCQALQLPRQEYSLRDPRVVAVLASNPVNNSIFGPVGLGQITVPVALGAGSLDPATPAVFEQFRSFPWLQTRDRSLTLIEGQAHVDTSQLDAGLSNLINSIPGLTLASPNLVDRYANAMHLAFFQLYVGRKVDYRIYLRSAYAQYLSQDQPQPMHLISAVSESALVPLEDLQLLPQR